MAFNQTQTCKKFIDERFLSLSLSLFITQTFCRLPGSVKVEEKMYIAECVCVCVVAPTIRSLITTFHADSHVCVRLRARAGGKVERARVCLWVCMRGSSVCLCVWNKFQDSSGMSDREKLATCGFTLFHLPANIFVRVWAGSVAAVLKTF